MAHKDEPSDGVNLSRRNFLKSTGVVGIAATVIAPAGLEAQPGVREVGPGDVPVRLNVNGRQLNLMIEPRVTLLDALRMRADLTGNKRVCDRGTCGACTMLVDGRPVYACSTLAIDVQGKQIRNVDGLANGQTLHPVQQAFCDKDALDVRLLHARASSWPASACSRSIPTRRPSRSRKGSTATSAAAARSRASSKRCPA